ncbi:MAG TPA: HAMP domain-containing sensor histidine kinase [Solirubrobacteraceae bacterium]|nr:HAMP domain-containing sensor histidine kinase [Solirubrobacteraceae bacterium]
MSGADGTLTTSATRNLFEVERCFVACAAHELRGELTLQRALAEAALRDANADKDSLREMGYGVVAACERQERLLEALLTLSRSDYGPLRREPVDLAATAAELLRAHEHRALRRTMALAPARTTGDPLLVERLVANLIENAVRHNLPGGRLDIATYTVAGHAIFTIANTGPVIPIGELPRLFEPFQRRDSHEHPFADGLGLGLAIVQSIADAHDAIISAQAQAGGGLRMEISFPHQRTRGEAATANAYQRL